VTAPLTATAGLNVHPKMRIGPILVPSYGMFFRTLVTHIRLERWPGGERGEAPEGEPSGHGEGPAVGDNHDGTALTASVSLMAGARSGDVFISSGDGPRARSFRFGVVGDGGVVAGMGDSTVYSGSALLRAGFADEPGGGLLYRILRDGVEVAWILGPELEWQVQEPGVYRVEVYTYSARLGRTFFRLSPWIFGNPVVIRHLR